MGHRSIADQRRREAYHAAGLCVRCRQPKTDRSVQHCPDCREYLSKAARARRAGRRTSPRPFGLPLTLPLDPYIEQWKPGMPTWGSSNDEGITMHDPKKGPDPDRNGGVRFMEPRNFWAWHERKVYGMPLKPCWKADPLLIVPNVDHGDWAAAKVYLFNLERARAKYADEPGSLTDSESASLNKEIKKWRLRANGNDIRYNNFGNRRGGLSREQAERVQHQLEMIRRITGDRNVR